MRPSILTEPAETQGLRHDRTTIVLHWATALLVVLLWTIGQTVDFAPSGPLRIDYRSLHILLGATLGIVLLARIAWRLWRGGMLPPLMTEVRRLTNGEGADVVIEVGGEKTLPQSLASVRPQGTIITVGAVSGMAGGIPPRALIPGALRMQGVYVGPRAMHEKMARFVGTAKIRPVVIITSEAGYHASYDQCTTAYLVKAGVPATQIALGEHGIHGNGHLMMAEKNNLQIAAVIGDWLASHVR